ncbi:hypothetical protein GCM10022221_49970 [Actinocorallia aurea]
MAIVVTAVRDQGRAPRGRIRMSEIPLPCELRFLAGMGVGEHAISQTARSEIHELPNVVFADHRPAYTKVSTGRVVKVGAQVIAPGRARHAGLLGGVAAGGPAFLSR